MRNPSVKEGRLQVDAQKCSYARKDENLSRGVGVPVARKAKLQRVVYVEAQIRSPDAA